MKHRFTAIDDDYSICGNCGLSFPAIARDPDLNDCRPLSGQILSDLVPLETNVRNKDWNFGDRTATMGLLLLLLDEVRGLRSDLKREPGGS